MNHVIAAATLVSLLLVGVVRLAGAVARRGAPRPPKPIREAFTTDGTEDLTQSENPGQCLQWRHLYNARQLPEDWA